MHLNRRKNLVFALHRRSFDNDLPKSVREATFVILRWLDLDRNVSNTFAQTMDPNSNALIW